MRIEEVLERLERYHTQIDEEHTCDVVKTGDASAECEGIVICTYPSVEVIRRAIELGANLIICHEPIFYSHEDTTDWLKDNRVYQAKAALLREHHLVVYRDHDRIHGGTPSRIRSEMDLIFYGIMKELGWEEYCVGFENKPLLYEIPETTAEELAKELIRKLNLTGARIVGDRKTAVRRVFFYEHVTAANFGGREPDKEAISEIEAGEYDVMIPFEIVDWTVSAYVRDSAALGRPRALIEMGHFNVEEAGMKYMEKWLPELLGQEMPVTYVPSGDSFSYLVREEDETRV